jgi:hypothetical protein
MIGQPSHSPAHSAGTSDDPLPEARELAEGAAVAGVGLKLLGGLAVRVICPDLPARLRAGQDMDFACLSRGRKEAAGYLESRGCVPDRRFNNLNGDRQMYFTAPSGRPIDVMVDRLSMCHVLDFRPTFDRMPHTLDAVDILLSKLQIFELNEKDVWDIIQLLSGAQVQEQAQGGSGRHSAGAHGGTSVLDAGRFAKVVAADWGWWRTVTGNLDKLPALAADKPHLVPRGARHDALAQARHLLDLAKAVPKSMKWKMRANVGDRVRWYELPEEVGH